MRSADLITPELLLQYGFKPEDIVSTRPLLGGLQHEVWQVLIDKKLYVLKRQRNKPNEIALALEDAASSKGIACPKLLHTLSGQPVVDGDDYFVRVYEYIEGKTLDRQAISEDLAYSIGEVLASLHLVSRKYLTQELHEAFQRPIIDYYKIIELNEGILKRVEPFTTQFDISKRDALIGHRDISGKNIILEHTTDKPYLIDFDEAGLTTVDGELLDAAFNLAGVHTEDGPRKSVVQACIAGYKNVWPEKINFDEPSFHILIGLSEYWWLGVCLNRLRDGRVSSDKLEEKEVARLTRQLPRDLASIDEWLGWLV